MKKTYLKAFVTKVSENKYQAIASSDVVDRYGDIVDQTGIDTTNYMLNPVMLWAHNSSEIPVAKCTGIDRSQAGKTIVNFEFNSPQGSPLAPYIQNSYDNGFLNALSIGFMENERSGVTITKSELLEISFVPVPANQEALKLAMKAKSFDFGDIRSDIEKAIDALAIKEVETEVLEKKDEPVVEPPKEEVKTIDETVIKSGKQISAKNAKIIQNAIECMKAHTGILTDAIKSHTESFTALEEMLISASSSSEQRSGEDDEDAEKGVLIISKEDAMIIRQQFRAIDRQNEVALSIVSRFLAGRN